MIYCRCVLMENKNKSPDDKQPHSSTTVREDGIISRFSFSKFSEIEIPLNS